MARIGVRSRPRILGVLGVVILGGGMLLGWFLWRGMGRVSPLQPGLIAYDAHDWPTAERAARGQLKIHRDDAEAQRLLARSLFRQGRDQTALAIQTRLPNNLLTAEDYFLRGQALVRLGQKEHGILAWRQALGKDLHHVETLVALEQVFFRLDLLNEAARAARNLATQPGWEARADLMLGRVHAEQSDPAGAAEALQRALARPDEWHGAERPDRVGKQLARFLLRTGRPDPARDAIHQIAGWADDPEACWLLSRCDLQTGLATSAAILTQAHSYREAHPLEPEPAPFVGEAQCRKCHPTNFQAQHHSRHARTFVRKEQVPSLSLPDRPIADPGNPAVTHVFSRSGDHLEVQTRVADHTLQTIVDYAFGSGDRGLTLVGHDRGDRPFEYRLSHYADPVGWDVTSGQPVHTDQPVLYQGMRITADAVRRCLVCHTTHAHAIVTGSGPESADAAIGCERCHGPAGHHLTALKANRADDMAIARPTLADASAIVAMCSQCHSPRDPDLPMSPGAAESVRFQGTTFTWSRCYTESRNTLDCVTCHNPHHDVETAPGSYEARCLDCHSADDPTTRRPDGTPTPTRPRRSQHRSAAPCPVQPDKGCIACHMPRVQIPMAHTGFTDHFIRVHRDGGPSASASQRSAP
jgi:tetratricopeptide (TPR) repeat protein